VSRQTGAARAFRTSVGGSLCEPLQVAGFEFLWTIVDCVKLSIPLVLFGETAEMPDDAEKRMSRLRDELADICQDYKQLRFTIVTCSFPIDWTVEEQEFLRAVLSERKPGIFTLFYSNDTTAFDPLPARKGCILWRHKRDDRSGVERLKKWGENCSRFFEGNPDFSGRFHFDGSECGFGSVLLAVSDFARVTPELSRLVAKPIALDLATKETSFAIPVSLRTLKPLPSLSLLGFKESAPAFLLEVLDHVLGRPCGPRLTVDVAKNEATLDGVTYRIDSPYILVVEALVKANGIPITRRRIQELYTPLKGYERLERDVIWKIRDKKCPPIGALIQSSEDGYWFPPEFLA
jgi:hypothetical protein